MIEDRFPDDELAYLSEKRISVDSQINQITDEINTLKANVKLEEAEIDQRKTTYEDIKQELDRLGFQIDNADDLGSVIRQASEKQQKSEKIGKFLSLTEDYMWHIFLCFLIIGALIFMDTGAPSTTLCEDGSQEIYLYKVDNGEFDCSDLSDENNISSRMLDEKKSEERQELISTYSACCVGILGPLSLVLIATFNNPEARLETYRGLLKQDRRWATASRQDNAARRKVKKYTQRLFDIEQWELPLKEIELKSIEQAIEESSNEVETES